MNRLRVSALVLVLALSGRGYSLADEARIPIFQPTTIVQPGHYILTRDIAIAGGNGITIQANNVILDLNGRRISSTTTSGNLVEVADGFSDIVIRGGFLSGGANAILAQSTAGTRVSVERVDMANTSNTGVQVLGPLQVDVISCKIRGAGNRGLDLEANSGSVFIGRIVDNLIVGSGNFGLIAFGLQGGQVLRNVVQNAASYGLLVGGSGNVIEGNESLANQLGIEVDGSGNQVLRNTTNGNQAIGIQVDFDDNRIAENIVSGNDFGIYVLGSRNLLENNLVEGAVGTHACGINFISSNLNAYRNNILQGNAGGGVCGAANTDAGGNIL